MKKYMLATICYLLIVATGINAQAVGDYGSNGTANWGTTNWIICVSAGTWSGATASVSAPTSAKNVWILNSDIITINTSASALTVSCKNLTVKSGATLIVGNATAAANVATLNSAGNVLVETGGTINSASTFAGVTNLFNMTGPTVTLQVDGNFGENNTTTHLMNVYPKGNGTVGTALNITSSLPSPPAMYVNYMKFQVANSAINFQRNVSITQTNLAMSYNNANGAGSYDNCSITIYPGVTVTTTGAIAIGTSATGTPTVAGDNISLNVNGTLILGGSLNSKGVSGKSFTVNVGAAGTFNIGKDYNVPTGQGTQNINVAAGGSVNFTTASSSCSIVDATTVINGTWNFANTSAVARTLGTATVNGKLQFSDNTYPTGITLNAGSTVEYKGSSAYILGSTSPVTYQKLIINNSNGITLFGSTTVADTLTVSTGSLTTGANNLTLGTAAVLAPATILNITGGTTNFAGKSVMLQSSAVGTASIAAITGDNLTTGLLNATNVTVQKYTVGGGSSSIAGPANSLRGYRFIGHPFSTAVPLTPLMGTTGIDITGTGGTGNGFSVTTGSNASSAFRYVAGDATANDAAGISSGWTAFTTGDGTGTNGTSATANTIAPYKGLRVFYRGTKGTGLDGVDYTVGSATISMAGSLNIGTQTIPLEYNTIAATGWNLVSNPYPSNVDMALLVSGRRTNIDGGGFYVWNPTAATRGAYETKTWGSTYTLPAYASFFVQASGVGASLQFQETDKVSTAATQTLFRGTSDDKMLKIKLSTGNVNWDELQVIFDKQSVPAKDKLDAVKLTNPDIDWYTLSSDKVKLAVDARQVNINEPIAIGLRSTAAAANFTATVTALPVIANTEWYLNDKWLNKQTKLELGTSYDFATSTDLASKGENRFELFAKAVTAIIVVPTNFSVKLQSNIINNQLQVNIISPTVNPTTIKVINELGQTVGVKDAGQISSGSITMDTGSFSTGLYFVEVQSGSSKTILKAVKN